MAKIKHKPFFAPRHWTLKQRLDYRTAPSDENGCQLWTGARSSAGYGHMFWEGKYWDVHRLVWVHANGPIPRHVQVCHVCDVKLCRNLKHLFSGSAFDNMGDAAAKGRMVRGSKVTGAKLNEIQVSAILRDDRDALIVAAQYGVSRGAIYDIRERRSWRHIEITGAPT